MKKCGDVQKVFVPGQADQKEAIPEQIKGVYITEKAAQKIHDFLSQSDLSPETHALWVAVTKDGCSGLSYKMDLKEMAPLIEQGDKQFTAHGASIVVDKLSYIFVTGSVLDYTEALTGSGFNLTNPNVKRSCSCGSSFNVG